MIDWEALEAAGHNFTMVSGMVARQWTYLLLELRRTAHRHVRCHRGLPRASRLSEHTGTVPRKWLGGLQDSKTRLDEMQQRALERSKEI